MIPARGPIARATPGADADNIARLIDALEGVLQAPLMGFMFSSQGLALLATAMTRLLGRRPHPLELAWVYKFATKRDLEVVECTLTVAPSSAEGLAPWVKRLARVREAHSLLYVWHVITDKYCTVRLIGASTLDLAVKGTDITRPSRAADALIAHMPAGLAVLSRHERRGVRIGDIAHWEELEAERG
jgi:hypothetical protein